MMDPSGRNKPSPKQPGPGKDGAKPTARSRTPSWMFWILLAALSAVYVYMFLWPQDEARIEIPYSTLLDATESGLVRMVEIEGQTVRGEFTGELRWTGTELLASGAQIPPGVTAEDVETNVLFRSTIPPETQDQFLPLLREHEVVIAAQRESQSILPTLLISFLPLLLIVGLIVLMTRNMSRGQQNVFGFGRSKAKMYDPERPHVTFADVAGEEEAKRELTEVVDFLKNPAKYHQIGARLPRGILLVGPPGTGKTLLARAVAGEAGVPFFSVSASEFVEMFVGVGASRVRDLFERAKAASPGIIFVDELDAVGRQRFAGVGGSNDEREQTLNQLLVEMDGFDATQDVIVVAATNRPDVLDPALLRPGRFDRQVTVGLPDRRGREAILRIHSRGIPVDSSVDLTSIAGGTPGFSGADLANLVNEAALTAARTNKKAVTRADFDEALDKIVLGTVRAALMNERDRLVVAYHEAGHAITAHFSPGADPLRKVSIVPRGRALGVTVQMPVEDRYNYPREYLLSRIAVIMGGRAAEMIVFDEITTGAQNDLKEATDLARRMVGLWGMSEEIGPVYLGTGEQHVFLGRELTQDRDMSATTLDRADDAVRRIVTAALDQAMALLLTRRVELDNLALKLMEEETVDEEQITELLGAPPVQSDVAAMGVTNLELRETPTG
ncbi:MAG TPA: ATP-dependent zinc metalloprotease FtsH [Thermomicrobiales bacterium]|nr:ATP-dependent zinc metalloprotease FtsH [Thermomicrobiales bacterium]